MLESKTVAFADPPACTNRGFADQPASTLHALGGFEQLTFDDQTVHDSK
jgi:hypothetical protein